MQYLKEKFTVPPPERVTACEACVYGRGEHAAWCPERKERTIGDRLMEVAFRMDSPLYRRLRR